MMNDSIPAHIHKSSDQLPTALANYDALTPFDDPSPPLWRPAYFYIPSTYRREDFETPNEASVKVPRLSYTNML